jgi:hypothetical protein
MDTEASFPHQQQAQQEPPGDEQNKATSADFIQGWRVIHGGVSSFRIATHVRGRTPKKVPEKIPTDRIAEAPLGSRDLF